MGIPEWVEWIDDDGGNVKLYLSKDRAEIIMGDSVNKMNHTWPVESWQAFGWKLKRVERDLENI